MQEIEYWTVYAATIEWAQAEFEQVYPGTGYVREVWGDEDRGVWTFEVVDMDGPTW